MKNKTLVVFMILVLLGSTIPILYDQAVDPETSTLLPGVNEYVVSADGDESSESITSFSETLADDTLFYPDLFENTTGEPATTGTYTGNGEAGTWANTKVKDGTVWRGSILPYTMELEFDGEDTMRGFTYAFYFTTVSGSADLDIYNYDTTTWIEFDEVDTGSTWYNGSANYDPDYWDASESFKIQIYCPNDGTTVYWDYAEVSFYDMHLVDSDHYAESFADVSEWVPSPGNTPTSDDDLMNWDIPDDAGYDWIYTNDPSLVAGCYIEFRMKINISLGTSLVSVRSFTADTLGGTQTVHLSQYLSTTWVTYKFFVTNAVESIAIIGVDASNPFRLYADYLRISPSDEMGWQHDGSTIEGFEDLGSTADWNYNFSSDGDIFKLETLRDATGGADSYCDFKLYYDLTSTSIDLEHDYYQFIEMRYRVTGSSGAQFQLSSRMDSKVITLANDFGDVAWTTVRFNFLAEDSPTTYKYSYFYVKGNEINDAMTIEIDWIKLYSIANFTVSDLDDETVTNVAYVDSGKLVVSEAGDYIRFTNDITTAISSATYSVWNATLLSGVSGFRFHELSQTNLYHDMGETRGALSSPILSWWEFLAYAGLEISAIKFIEDGTAPTIVRSSVNPPEPDDDESVTISCLASDAVEIYTVKFNAIVYPAGFSDVDYSGSEIVGDFWSYEFSSGDLPAGYYSFQVTANDGANENQHLTEFEYIDFTVRISEISITPITFFGAGEDFSQMQISFEINKDCTYTIYEVSDSEAESATGTGSVTEGWNNIAWSKLDVIDSTANFSIKFVSGSLTEWVNGSYGVAQTVFVLEDHTTTDHATLITVAGTITKDASWALYYDGAGSSSYSGSVSEGNFVLSWTKHITPGSHTWILTFTNGSDSESVGGSFETYQYSIDDPPANEIPDPDRDWRFQQTTWNNIFLIIIILGVVAILLRDEQTKMNLPDMGD